MTNSRKLFAGKITDLVINEAGSKRSQFQISIYFHYAPGGSKLVVLSPVGDCIYWYIFEELGKWI